jgi:hypothetical protein
MGRDFLPAFSLLSYSFVFLTYYICPGRIPGNDTTHNKQRQQQQQQPPTQLLNPDLSLPHEAVAGQLGGEWEGEMKHLGFFSFFWVGGLGLVGFERENIHRRDRARKKKKNICSWGSFHSCVFLTVILPFNPSFPTTGKISSLHQNQNTSNPTPLETPPPGK